MFVDVCRIFIFHKPHFFSYRINNPDHIRLPDTKIADTLTDRFCHHSFSFFSFLTVLNITNLVLLFFWYFCLYFVRWSLF